MSKSTVSSSRALLLGCVALSALAAGMSAARADDNPVETVVVTGTRFNVDAAPAKASLTTTEPETIINRSYIENFIDPQADYVTILSIVPSMTGGDINGPGLSDGGTKNTLRGMPDGNFNMTYDGIPFGDTNGPTHHNISYFPASTIGSAIVDRGPGNAGQLGANTYGGTVKLFSEGLTDDSHAKVSGSYGSFNTAIGVVNGQTGDLPDFGIGTIRAMANLQYLHSDGALTGQDLFTNNVLLKVEDQINDHWKVTLFGDTAFLKENLDDNNGATPAQVAVYGINFALQTTNPALPTYQPYNYTSKHTDMDYVRVNGDLLPGMKLENTVYTYAYWNHTLSPNNQTQTLCDIQNDTSEGNYPSPANTASCSFAGNSKLVLANGTTDNANAILGYSKQNAYRVYGDILRVSQDYDFGWIDGQVRAGVWWETQATHRFKYYYDSVSCFNAGIDPFDVGDVAATAACGVAYKPFKGNYTGPAANGFAYNKAKSVQVGSILGVNELGFAKDDEHSDWSQYEPFVEVDIKALDDRLTITPGLKYIHWDHGVNAPVGQGNLCGVGLNDTNTGTPPTCTNAPGQNFRASFITRDLLPFLEANYKIGPSWSVYFEFAKGIYVPDIGTFEQSSATAIYPAPETTTNYQIGTVYYADNFNFDADVYYIPIHNNYGNPVPCSFDPSEQCYQNTGTATYQGVEGEGTYTFDDLFGFDARGLSVFANGALMSSKSGSAWLTSAPAWTVAAGVLFKRDAWKFGVIEKLVGPQYSDAANTKAYELHTYGNLNAVAGYAYEYPGLATFELDLNADNLADSRKPTALTINDSKYQTNQMLSTNQYFFQPPRSFMATLKVLY